MTSEKTDGKNPETAASQGEKQQKQTGPKIVWDSKGMQSTYTNVFNVSGAREEFVFFFGMNQAWDAVQNELKVQLTNRVVMSPFAAKRLSTLLNNAIGDYEKKFGTLDEETAPPPDTTLH